MPDERFVATQCVAVSHAADVALTFRGMVAFAAQGSR